MTNLSPLQQQLRRIDQQLTENRQRIAVLNLENVELENTRLTLLRLAEQDAIAAGRPHMAGHQILVTPAPEKLLQLDDGSASRAAKYGVTPSKPNESPEARRKRLQRDRDRRKAERKKMQLGAPDPVNNLTASPRGHGKHRAVAANVVKLLRKNGELLTGSMVAMLGLNDDRQSLSNALYQLKKDGVITQDRGGQPYKLVNPNGAAAHP